MQFLYSLLFAAAFSAFCGKALRKHPAPFYLAAAVLSIGTTVLANTRISLPAFLQQNIISLFTKGILAAALWAVIMWTGALPNGSSLMKRLMPQRGQLSIFAAILTLGHAVGLGISMFPRWIGKSDILNLAVCMLLMLIMLPLTVISVQKIRRKMKAKTWKSVQRFAYLFYALIPVHVIVLNIAKARSGRKDVLLNLMLYLVVFLGYAVCRLNKWYQVKKKPERLIGLKLASWGAFLIGMTVFAAAAFPQKQPESMQTNIAEMHEEPAQTEPTAAARTTAFSAQSSETVTTSGTDSTARGTTDQTTGTTEAPAENDASSEQDENDEPAEQTESSAAEAVPEETAPPAPVRIYQDGTFTASAYGYDGNITVHVTILEDSITDITAETEESDDSYFNDAKSAVIPAIIRSQAADVDACSGATYSSNGIMEAVRAALESARL
ncbi:MAG: FMN-binding protein [Oscillospiraceae bacterium]|nr:FMN-binding protein [Oscillospiraceae bacterium]